MVETSYGIDLKNKLLAGIQKLNNSVSSTLGPGGRTVLIKDASGELKVTKDGVTVAKAFSELEDPIEDLGAQLVKQVSIKSANEAGDGTTTSTLLATTMVEEGLKLLGQGSNPVEVKKGIDKAVKLVVEELKKLALDINDEKHIKAVATISGNNDEEIGNLIATALEKVGREGVVAIEESKSGETSLEVVEGMQFERGYKSPYFITDNNTMSAIIDDAYVLLYDGRVTTAAELLPVLQKVSAENKSLLIVAEDIDGEALATLIVNKARGIVKVIAVKAPDFGERRTMALEDLATVTGGQVISKEKGLKLDKIPVAQYSQYLGKARTINVNKDKTTVIDGGGTEEAISTRAEEIKAQLDKAQSFFEKEKLQERLGKLIGGVAIVSVGGNSEIEIREKKDRVEDALFATKAALAEGIIPGGGISLIRAFNNAMPKAADFDLNEMAGFKIIQKACFAPFTKILDNAGITNWYEILHQVLSTSDSDKDFTTYNVKTSTIANALTEGLLDPVKVTRIALENASSVAGTILTTESVVFEKKDEKNNDGEGMNLGM